MGVTLHKEEYLKERPSDDLLIADLSSYLNTPKDKSILVTSSKRSALEAVYKVLGVSCPVIPALTSSSTKNSVPESVLTCDVHPQTGCVTVPILESLPVHSYDAVVASCPMGIVPNLRELEDFCRATGKKLIVEAFDSFGTPGLSSYGDATCFSFGNDSVLSAGVVVLPNDLFYSAEDALAHTETAVAEPICSLLLSVLEDEIHEVWSRTYNSDVYLDKIAPFVPASFIKHTSFKVFPTFLPSKGFALRLKLLFSQEGIEVSKVYPASCRFPAAYDLYHRSLCVPTHSEVTKEALEKICYLYSRI